MQTRAPKALIGILSPTDREYARAWRQACLDTASRPKLKDGDVIELAEPMLFSDGRERRRFVVRKGLRPGRCRKSTWLVCQETGVPCKPRAVMARDWYKLG